MVPSPPSTITRSARLRDLGHAGGSALDAGLGRPSSRRRARARRAGGPARDAAPRRRTREASGDGIAQQRQRGRRGRWRPRGGRSRRGAGRTRGCRPGRGAREEQAPSDDARRAPATADATRSSTRRAPRDRARLPACASAAPGLELRLDERQQPVGTGEARQHGGSTSASEMNETSTTARSPADPGRSPGASRRALTPSSTRHAVVAAQPLVQLAAADVERDHVRRARLQQAVGEAAGRGADVEAARARDVDRRTRSSAVASLSPPRETKAGPRSTSSAASPGIDVPAFVTRRPSTRTRPAMTSACARLRVSARPRSQSS